MTTSSSAPASTTRTSGGLVTALRASAALAVAAVLSQFITAGQLFPSGGPQEAHAAGAIVLHVVSGLAALAAVLLWRRGVVGLGLTALAVVDLGLGFVQAALGGYQTLYVHVPGAMLLTAGVVWLLVASFRARRA